MAEWKCAITNIMAKNLKRNKNKNYTPVLELISGAGVFVLFNNICGGFGKD